MNKPRRPAQLDDAQIEAIEGAADVAYNSEIAHTSAQALLKMGRHFREDDPEVTARVIKLVDEEGVDVIAESWVNSPEDSLPGILWRGYLLREWIRKESDSVAVRYRAAQTLMETGEQEDRCRFASVPKPGVLRQEWDLVLNGTYEGDVPELLAGSARFLSVLGEVDSVWIASDSHPLATRVTRRDSAFSVTAKEFAKAAKLAAAGELE